MPTDEQRAAELLGRVEHGRVATSMRALPFLASARHIVVDGRVLLRLHRGHGYHRACVGGVVAYGAEVPSAVASARSRQSWSVQVVGECAAVEPTTAELDRFGRRRAPWTVFPSIPSTCASNLSSRPCTP